MTDSIRPPSRRVTRRDVARRAGVSDAVVSYTLNGGAPVASATAQRVRDAIAELGYQPNHTAIALRSGSANAIAMIAPPGGEVVFANPFFAQFTNLVETDARERGYALFTASAAPGRNGVLDRARDFVARQVDGLIVISGELDHHIVLDSLGVPWVQINAPTPEPGVASVGVDLYGGAKIGTDHLIAHGHTRIAFVGEGPEEPRHRGWRDACAEAGVAAEPFQYAAYSRESGYAAGLALAERKDRPSAVFVASDLIGLGVLRAMHEKRVSIPEAIAIVSFDGSWASEYSWPRLTTVRQPIEAMASAALEKLLNPHENISAHQTFEGKLVIGDSCGTHPHSVNAT
jgi:LacI family transcriptional regulator